MKNLLVLTLEFYDWQGVKRKASKIVNVDVTFTEDAEHWFNWAMDGLARDEKLDWDADWGVMHWSLTPLGASAAQVI